MTVCNRILLFCIALTVLLLTGCSGSKDPVIEAPSVQPIENVVRRDQEKDVSSYVAEGVDIVMDTTDSMAGFAQSPALTGDTAFVRVVDKLVYTAKLFSRKANVSYFRSDADVMRISETAFQDYTTPAFYIPRRWYTARKYLQVKTHQNNFYNEQNIANAIEQADPNRVTVIITDLFENQSTNERLTALIKSKYLSQEGTVAVIPVRSEFDGNVYDIFEINTKDGVYYHGADTRLEKGEEPPTFKDISKWESAVERQKSPEPVQMDKLNLTKISGVAAIRPFYMICLGPERVTQKFVEDYKRELEDMEGEPVEIGLPLLVFNKAEKPRLIGTEGIGDKLTIEQSGLEPLNYNYFVYDDRDDPDKRASLLTSRDLPRNMLSNTYIRGSVASVDVEIPVSVFASPNAGQDEAILEKLYAQCSLIPVMTFYNMNVDSAFIGENQTAYVPMPFDLNAEEMDCLVNCQRGDFALNQNDKLRADAQLRIHLDPSAIPAGLSCVRVRVDTYLRAEDKATVESPTLDYFPWAEDWNLTTAGQSVESWDLHPQARQMNGTINLRSFIMALLRSKEEITVIDPDPFPKETLAASFIMDLLVR